MSKMSTRRKLAIASWSAPQEGNIYGKLQLDAEEVVRFLDHVRATTGERVTITHFVGRVVGEALAAAPGLNGHLFLGSFHPNPSVDIAYLVALGDGEDLAKVKMCGIDRMSILEIAQDLRARAEKLRGGRDPEFEKSKGPLKLLPTWLIRPMVAFTGWLTSSLGVAMPAFGLEAFPFGSAVVTSVGMLGVDEGYVPPTPWAHVPLYVAVGAIRDLPAVVDGAVVPRKQVVITATLDHRYVDGAQASKLAKVLRARFADPWPLLGESVKLGAEEGSAPSSATPPPVASGASA
jgi:pyruvate/2-oxoglutarate dehydrogenase complex dihydrolipoamide acyltransferase (E2) component